MILAVGTMLLTAAHWSPIRVEATAYCPCTKCCGKGARGITASGLRTNDRPYGIAAPKSVLLIGAVVYVPLGVGYLDKQRSESRLFTVDDLMPTPRKAFWPMIDLRFKDHESAVRFGRKIITIYVWNP